MINVNQTGLSVEGESRIEIFYYKSWNKYVFQLVAYGKRPHYL